MGPWKVRLGSDPVRGLPLPSLTPMNRENQLRKTTSFLMQLKLCLVPPPRGEEI